MSALPSDAPVTKTPPAENHATGSLVQLKLQREGFLDGRRCATLEMTTTTGAGVDELLQHTCRAARRLIVPKDFHAEAAALVLRADLQNDTLPNVQFMALALAAGIICKRHAKRKRNTAATTVWACLPGWKTNGATRIYRQKPPSPKARATATFLPADNSQHGAKDEAGDPSPNG